METRIITIKDIARQKEEIAAIGRMLREGELAAFPTETVYGVGANGLSCSACQKLYAAKNRPLDKPIAELIADFDDLFVVADELASTARILAKRFMPGPITLVVKKSARVPSVITGNGETVGVRMPACELTRAIIRAAGVPLATPSANLSGNTPPVDAAGAFAELAGRIAAVVDGGKTRFAVPSTVVDCTGEKPKILRTGVITEEMIHNAIKETFGNDDKRQ